VLDDAEKALLWYALEDEATADARAAEAHVRGCIARLGIAALDARKKAIDARRGSCTDPAAQDQIDEEVQQIVSRRLDLRKRLEQV
jgi:hypothetical protein